MMEFINSMIDELLRNVGDLWFAALAGQFLVMICESAKPKPAEGEGRAEPQGFALLVMILSLVTPLLLLLHAVATGSGAPIAAVALVGGAIVIAGIIGLIIGNAAPSVGRTLTGAAPFLAVAVFGLTIYVTWRSAFGLLDMLVAG
jgi:FtsH-binding integral membrane protein